MLDYAGFIKAVLRQERSEIRSYFADEAVITWHCTNERFTVEEYALMFLVLAWGFRRLIPALLRRADPYAQLALPLFCWSWAVSTMYMSADFCYLAASFFSVCCTTLALIALRREEAAP